MSRLRTVSWVLLAVVALLVLLASLSSAALAYRGRFAIGGVPIAEIAAGREAVLEGLRGARGTAAAWATGFSILLLAVVVGPYRRGEVVSWWGILAATLVVLVVAAARLPLTGARTGVGEPLVLAVVVLLALLLDVRRLTARP